MISVLNFIMTAFFLLAVVSYFSPSLGGFLYPFIKEKRRGPVLTLNLAAVFLCGYVLQAVEPTPFEQALGSAQPTSVPIFAERDLGAEVAYLSSERALQIKGEAIIRHYDLSASVESPTGQDFVFAPYLTADGAVLLVNQTDEVVLKAVIDTTKGTIQLEALNNGWKVAKLSGFFERGTLDRALAQQAKARKAYIASKAAEERKTAASENADESTQKPKRRPRPAPARQSASRGPVPEDIKSMCRESSGGDNFAYIRCLNINWNFKR
jgi:hypothetical protein